MVSKVALSSTYVSCINWPDFPSVSWMVTELVASVASDDPTTANWVMELWESPSPSPTTTVRFIVV